MIRRWSGLRQHRVRQHLAERETASEGHRDAGERDAQRGPADASHQPQVGLHSGQQQQHQNAELRNRIEHGLLLGTCGKQRVLQVRPQRAQHRGPEQDAGEQLAHDRRLPDALHGLAQQAPDEHQRDQLHEENDFRRAALAALGGERHRRAQHQQRGAAGRGT